MGPSILTDWDEETTNVKIEVFQRKEQPKAMVEHLCGCYSLPWTKRGASQAIMQDNWVSR
jgi:hypothetical protein